MTLSSISAGSISSGAMPNRASSATRRGLAEARTSRGALTDMLFEAVGDAPFGQVVGRQFDQHLVADQHADAILAHLAGGMPQDLMFVFQADAEHRVGEQLDHLAAHLEKFFLGQRHLPSDSRKRAALTPGGRKRKPERLVP